MTSTYKYHKVNYQCVVEAAEYKCVCVQSLGLVLVHGHSRLLTGMGREEDLDTPALEGETPAVSSYIQPTQSLSLFYLQK